MNGSMMSPCPVVGKSATTAARASVLAAELDATRLAEAHDELGVGILPAGSEQEHPCDVFSPCAMGGSLHDLSIQRLRCRVVCGAAFRRRKSFVDLRPA